MSFFEKMRRAVDQTTEASVSNASKSVVELWTLYNDKICGVVLTCASEAASRGSCFITDDEKYMLHVVDPAWEMLPTPIRLIGRERLNWDKVFASARSRIFLIDGDSVTIHPEAKEQVGALFAKTRGLQLLQNSDKEHLELDVTKQEEAL